jgi:hypothetical protein
VDVPPALQIHPDEEVLEEYAFNRLPSSSLAQVEEHILLCPACQEAVLDADEFRALMKSELRTFERRIARAKPTSRSVELPQASLQSPVSVSAELTPSHIQEPSRRFHASWPWASTETGAWWGMSGWKAGLALASAAVVIPVIARVLVADRTPQAPVAIELATQRGNTPDKSAPANRPLALSLDATTLLPTGTGTSGQAEPRYQLQLVDSQGTELWSGAALRSGSRISAQLPGRFRAGNYWVRLYRSQPQGGGSDDLLREFRLQLQ